ncbi:MAG: dienelactone hydrolase [Rhodothermales bacterium]|jgi:dienelactone hydrolase
MRSTLPLLFIGLAVLLIACSAGPLVTPSDHATVLAEHTLREVNPSEPGTWSVKTLYYGSGTDRRRSVFRDSVAIVTDSVDASKLVSLGESAKSRNRYWGFAPEAFPLNGRVWYPDGDGPFPLVLIAHGNHNMKDFSDPGYGYLGELLASQGYIFVSVDMNFVNGGIRGENDARGWLFLKHLEAWRTFNQTPDGPLYKKADLEEVALIGHSRGGEAVAHAAAFNKLGRYPDDGTLSFDFGFGIRSIIAIAPVDGQYLPTGRSVPLTDVNYLVFHGSHDGDVSSFHGLRQYQRVSFSPGSDYFKSAVYMYRANHGQWNTVWNNKDNGPRSGRILRLDSLVPAEEQRQFAKVYIPAFLDATLKKNDRYLSLFPDHRTASDWLPRTMYLARYQHASFRPLADFEGDIDLETGSETGVRLAGDSLKTWKENELVLRSRNRANTSASQQNQAAWLSWERDSTNTIPQFRITLPDSLTDSWDVGPTSTVELLLSPAEPGASEDSLAVPGASVDLSIQLSDRAGHSARVRLSGYGPIREPLDIQILRRNRDAERFENTWENVLQGFSIPVADFVAVEPALDLNTLLEIALVFDLSPKGQVVIDDIGLANPPEGFLRHRIPMKQ